MVENFPNLKKEINIQIQEAQRAPNKLNPNRPTPRHIIITMAEIKHKERILKAARGKQRLNYKGTPVRLSAGFSIETLQDRTEKQDICKVLEGKNCSLEYSTQQDYHLKGEIKNFSNKHKLKEYSNPRPILKEILKVLL